MTGIVIQSTGTCTDRTLPMRNPLWTPSLLTGRTLDLDGDTGYTVDTSNRLLTWIDQAGGKVFTPSAGDKPLRTYPFGTHTVPEFTLDGMSAASAITTTAAHWCMWAVIDMVDVTVTANQMLFFASPFEVIAMTTGGKIRILGPGSGSFEPGSLSAGKQILVLSQQTAGTQALRVNGVQLGAAQTGCSPIAMAAPQIGLYDPGLKDTAIAAFGLAAGVQALVDVQKLEGYLAWRFGLTGSLPSTHPYASVQPRKLT